MQHGWNSTSFQVLEDGYRYWFWGQEACVAYVDTGRAWVVAGAPIAPEVQLGEVVTRFLEEAHRAGRRVCFFAVEARLLTQTALRSKISAVRSGQLCSERSVSRSELCLELRSE